MNPNLKPHTYFFDLALYSEIKVESEEDINGFLRLFQTYHRIDAYNPILKEQTTYTIGADASYSAISKYNGHINRYLICSRTEQVINIFSFYDHGTKTLQKIGQFPSIASLHISKIKDYSKVLDEEKLREFTKAIGLVSHGVGVGSFVYLRRIFEHLLSKKCKLASLLPTWNDELYKRAKVAEKIELLKDFLPEFLVQNKSMYGILSMGVHSLTENECLQYFSVVKDGIEMILDEELEKIIKARKIEEVKRNLEMLNRTIK
jgi:hypothetical protein